MCAKKDDCYPLLRHIDTPADLKRLDRSQLPGEVAVGDQVSLEMRSSLGMRAVLLTMIIPTILIIAITIILSYLEAGTLPVWEL